RRRWRAGHSLPLPAAKTRFPASPGCAFPKRMPWKRMRDWNAGTTSSMPMARHTVRDRLSRGSNLAAMTPTTAEIQIPELAARSVQSEELEELHGEKMVLNMGPSHPSTHGVLRIILELD